jgi:hypothetical protein
MRKNGILTCGLILKDTFPSSSQYMSIGGDKTGFLR